MTGEELKEARRKLGFMWGYNGPIRAAELGRALGETVRDPGRRIASYEDGTTNIPVHFAILIEVLLAGAPLPTLTDLRLYKPEKMTEQNLEALKAEFRKDYFRYLVEDGEKEGYAVDFETEFDTWLSSRNAEASVS